MSNRKRKIFVATVSAALVASSLTPAVTADAAKKMSKQMQLVIKAHKNLMLYGSNNPSKASFDLREDVAVNKDIYTKWQKSNDFKQFFKQWNKLSATEKKHPEMKKVKEQYQAAKAYLQATKAVFAYYNEALILAEEIVKNPAAAEKLTKLESEVKKQLELLNKKFHEESKRMTYVQKKSNTVKAFVSAANELNGAKTEEEAKKALDKMKNAIGNYSATLVKIATSHYQDVLTQLHGNGSGNGSNNGNGGSTGNETFDLSLMHTNDTHAWVENMPKMVTAVKEVREKKPNALLVNAGDVFSGTLYFNEFKGQADLAFMNLMKYDLMTFGNHEFDLGSTPDGHKELANFVKGAKFSFVSSNVDFSADENMKALQEKKITTNAEAGKIYNGVVKEVNGEKVGFFGLTTEETVSLSSVGSVAFANYIESAKQTVQQFEEMGINKIVAITHIGYDDSPKVDNDLQLAANVDGIDVIVGGHSHTKLEKETVVNTNATGVKKDPTIIVQAYQYADFLGTVDVQFNKQGKIVGHAAKLIETKNLEDDPEAKQVLQNYKQQVDAIANEPIGVTNPTELENPRTNGDNSKPSVRKNETALGNLLTDGMLAKAKEYNKEVVMAFQNGGGIRAPLPAGELTTGQIITVLPFGNTLATMSLTGAEIKRTFEISVGKYPIENGGFLHVAGAKVKFDSTKPEGERISSIKLVAKDGTETELDLEKTYTVATNAFTAKGGDGFDVLKKAYEEGRVTDLGLSDWGNLKDHIVSVGADGGKLEAKVEGRIVDIATNEKEPIPVSPDNFNGTSEGAKVFNSSVVVNVENVQKLEYAEVIGDLLLLGTPAGDFVASHIKVFGNLDLTQFGGDISSLVNIEVSGETKL